jgi:hypothetical protein
MVKPKGGRGQRAPYQSQTMRVPVALRERFEQEIEQYRSLVLGGESGQSDETPNPSALDRAIDEVLNNPTVTRSGKIAGLLDAH